MAAVLSEHDQKYLNADQQKQVLALKEQYAAATDPNVKADLNKQAENIRASAGYTGGKDGGGYTQLQPQSNGSISAYQQTASNPEVTPQVNTSLGGQSAQDVEQYLKDYKYDNLSKTNGWINGYGVDGNLRSMSNYIRQQMDKNTQDWHVADDATKDYLHQQNVELEKLLQKYAGGAESYYDPVTGKWSTGNGNTGYGEVNIGPYEEWAKYGISKDYYDYLRNTNDRYYNMVDYRSITNPVQNEDGFSGIYSPYEYGTIQNYLSHGTAGWGQPMHYDAIGDGFMDEYSMTPVKDENGNIVFMDDFVKHDVLASNYTQQFAPEIVNGIIQPSGLGSGRGGWVEGESKPVSGNLAAQEGYVPYAQRKGSGSGSGDYSSMLEEMYGEALAAQLAQLESSYKQNISDLDANVAKTDANYNEQKRQADGTAAMNAAAFRELANAYGLNSGAIGQAAQAQNNQRQSDLNTLGAAQAQAQAEIERQRTLLGQQYQLQINQAIAENNYQKAEALYNEAVRADEALRQEQQFNANMMLQYAQMAMQQQQYNSDLALQYAKMAGTGGSGGGGGDLYSSDQYIAAPDYTAAYQAALASGNPENYLSTKDYYNQFGIYSDEGLWNGYEDWIGEQQKNEYTRNRAALSAANKYRSMSGNNGNVLASMLARDGFTPDEIGHALDSLGIR